eukprot:5236717-Pyramimonas_sp.AAC.1
MTNNFGSGGIESAPTFSLPRCLCHALIPLSNAATTATASPSNSSGNCNVTRLNPREQMYSTDDSTSYCRKMSSVMFYLFPMFKYTRSRQYNTTTTRQQSLDLRAPVGFTGFPDVQKPPKHRHVALREGRGGSESCHPTLGRTTSA